MQTRKSSHLYSRATRVMVGGVSSPVRAYGAVGGTPLFISRGKGAKLWDVDGNTFVDHVCSWGAVILGHADSRVLSYVRARMRKGTSFGAPTEEEVLLAEEISRAMPSVEKLRFVNSGTEATMSAVRAARGFTKRSKVVKFEGCYHGHADEFLSGAGSGLATLDIPKSAGVTEGSVADTVTLPYNDPEAIEEEFSREGGSIAGVILEPVAGNMGVVLPDADFLRATRKLCASSGSLLIFDEVITGFRVARGGAQSLFGVEPDLTTLGKVIGGGFPVGAYGGRKEVMEVVAPEGPVYQAGTLAGNPVAMVAGLKTLELLDREAYDGLDRRAGELEQRMVEAASGRDLKFSTARKGSMLGVFFREAPPKDFKEAMESDTRAYGKFFWGMLRGGAYLPPSAFETLFVTLAHTESDVSKTVTASAAAFKELKS